MPQYQGTSIEGFQKIVTSIGRELPLFSINVGTDSTAIPKVVGYFYVSLFVNTGDNEVINERGLLYVPGVVRQLPDISTTQLSILSMWVNWKVPGLDYVLFF